MTPAGIEPATYLFIAQNLNHSATAAGSTSNTNFREGTEWKFLCSVQTFMGADKALARPGRKQANVSVRMA